MDYHKAGPSLRKDSPLRLPPDYSPVPIRESDTDDSYPHTNPPDYSTLRNSYPEASGGAEPSEVELCLQGDEPDRSQGDHFYLESSVDTARESQPLRRSSYNSQLEAERRLSVRNSQDFAERAPANHSSSGVGSTLRDIMPDMSQKGPLICIAIVVGIIALLVVILLPMSFATLEYYEYGFKRRKSTGSVDVDHVYGAGGRHFVGPDYEFKIFPADAHFDSFKAVTVFAADRLQVTISCDVQYFLRKEQLQLLHKNYDIYYKPILKNNAMDALKGAATSFTTREYIRDREKIERVLFKAVRERLGGTCCEPRCGTKDRPPCIIGCREYSRCSEADFGLFTEVRYFQLTRVDIPDELNQRYLQALVLQEATETEKLRQNATVLRRETDALVKRTENEAYEISQNATAQSELITSRAKADSRATVEEARSDGLKLLYSELGITDSEQRASFDYLRTLRGQDNARLNVDFDQVIAGPFMSNN